MSGHTFEKQGGNWGKPDGQAHLGMMDRKEGIIGSGRRYDIRYKL
jgi:hypothetical protein